MKIHVFANEEFKAVRAFSVYEEPCFIARDILISLGYKNPKETIAKLLDIDDGVIKYIEDRKDTLCIGESEVLSLISSCSDKAKAERFRKMMTTEILPALHTDSSDSDELTLHWLGKDYF